MLTLRLCQGDASEVRITKDNVPASMEILSLMYHTRPLQSLNPHQSSPQHAVDRRQYTGKGGPMFMDEISAKKLCDESFMQ